MIKLFWEKNLISVDMQADTKILYLKLSGENFLNNIFFLKLKQWIITWITYTQLPSDEN
jgi:hypothetical protein